ncbi:hypothetical protein Cni_G19340 [Canna indica]|uniref:Uncharacterized protein n=1 Tax=Canna indica TaxID=4628 RepID=A0AAQ3QF66_9LILI|nr:hypothetical protein Cni_G19340 [Canna indica]
MKLTTVIAVRNDDDGVEERSKFTKEITDVNIGSKGGVLARVGDSPFRQSYLLLLRSQIAARIPFSYPHLALSGSHKAKQKNLELVEETKKEKKKEIEKEI